MRQAPGEPCEADLDLILFRVGGVRYGADAGEVGAAMALGGAAPEGLRWFHESMAYPGGPVDYRRPMVLALRGDTAQVVVDDLEDIVRIPIAELLPFPSLIEPAVRGKGLWAIARRGRELILLVDLHRLLASPARHADPRAS